MELETLKYQNMSNEIKTNIKLSKKQNDAYTLMAKGKNIFLTGAAGSGKCLGVDTPVIMYDGTIKMVQDVQKNDIIMGDDSTPRNVLSTTEGIDTLYQISTTKGDSYIVNSHHILTFKVKKTVVYIEDKEKYVLKWGDSSGFVKTKHFYFKKDAILYSKSLPDLVDIPVTDSIEKNKNKNWRGYFKGVYARVDFKEQKTKLYPYKLGLYIGGEAISSKDIIKCEMLKNKNKYIPLLYKANSRKKRLQLLAGIFDSMSYLYKGKYTIHSLNIRLLADIYFLARSLGYNAKLKHGGVCVSGDMSDVPSLKGDYTFDGCRDNLISCIKIENNGSGKYHGFEIDGNHRFLLGNFIITHNTACIKLFIKVYRLNRIIGVTSTTGISALLFGGVTLHSFTGIGLGNGSVDAIVTKIFNRRYLMKRWNDLETLVIDEISMLSPVLFDKLEEIARRVRHNDEPFGGIQLILSGDFCQLPCVKSDDFCFEAKTWDSCIDNTVYLTEIMRQKDKKFQDCLNEIRVGVLSNNTQKLLTSRLHKKLKNDYGIQPTKLYSTNRAVDYINNEELDKLADNDPEFFEYNMEVKVYPCVKNKKYAEEKYKKCCNAPETLQLCKGAQVMLLHNLDLDAGLVNGSRGVVTSFVDDCPMVRFLNGREITIGHHIWEHEENDQKVLRVIQIPLKLAYALTIHKSQGCSLDYAEVDLSDTFEYGQSYVAISRVRNIEGLSFSGIDFDKIKASPKAVEFYKNLT